MSSDSASSIFTTPEWVKHAIFYQIFPERFANGDPTNDSEGVQPWGTPPAVHNFMGGDLRGVINNLNHLQNLGITAIYLNPIFFATSNHKYNTTDYFRIDPRFGTLETFHELIEQAHQRGIRIILDAVFNHCGRGFFAFQDILENGSHSPYLKWFNISQLPINPYDERAPSGYATWWDYRSLPKFNTDHLPVRRYLLDVARYWIEQGVDGWRLDVPNEIADHSFWREFRQVVKAANPEAYIVGEIWQDGTPWLDGTQFDAVMNYLFRDLCRDFFARETITQDVFAQGVEELLRRYPLEVTQAQLNLFSSHDTPRFLTEAGGNLRHLTPAIIFQMTFPGAPCIYYGDEIGMAGAGDPECRGCFPWQEALWNKSLLSLFQRTIAIRKDHPALRTGQFRTIFSRADLPYTYARWNEDELLLVALNRRDQPRTLDLPLDHLPPPKQEVMRDLLSDEVFSVRGHRVEAVRIPARSGVILATG